MFYTSFSEFTAQDFEHFRIIGRTGAHEAGLPLSWSNSGMEFRFRGSRAELHFAAYESDQPVYVKAFTDKTAQRFGLDGKSPKLLFDFEKDGVHTVRILRISEGNVPLVFEKARVYGKAPALLAPPKEKPFKIEFMGDSITAGFGITAPREQNVYTTYEQDSTQTYAYLTAEKLDAELRTECISGQGVWHSCGTEVGIRFTEIFDMALRGVPGYDHASWQPDVMVLNCGTNDVPGGTTPEIMYREAGLLLDKVRAAYPDAQIIWLYGMMNAKFSDTFKTLIRDRRKTGDRKLHYLYVPDIYGKKDEVGAIGHPNVNASVRVAGKLAGYIQKLSEK